MQARVRLGFAPRRGSPRLDEPLESSACGEGGWVSAKVASKLKSLYLGGSWSWQGSEVWGGISLQPGARYWVSGPSTHICSLALRGGPGSGRPLPCMCKKAVVFSWSWANISSFPWPGRTLEGMQPEWAGVYCIRVKNWARWVVPGQGSQPQLGSKGTAPREAGRLDRLYSMAPSKG